MAFSVMKQPNGKYAIYCSIETNFVLLDAGRKEVIDFIVEDGIEQSVRLAKRYLDRADGKINPPPGYNFDLALKFAEEAHDSDDEIVSRAYVIRKSRRGMKGDSQ